MEEQTITKMEKKLNIFFVIALWLCSRRGRRRHRLFLDDNKWYGVILSCFSR